MRTLVLTSLLAITLAAGCLDEAPAANQDRPPAAAASSQPSAVVAFLDTGINPYHATFRDDSPRAFQHPSTYLPDYPADAIALDLTFDAKSWEDAVAADCRSVWSTIEPETLYWFPGTKIVGAIYPAGESGADCDVDGAPVVRGILDYNGHGTMVASRGASPEYGACHECLVVSVQGYGIPALAWMTEHASWIDAQSNSWGPIAPVPGPNTEASGVLVDSPALSATIEAAGQAHLAFWASGNGAATRWGVLGHPTVLDPRLTPSVVMVGGHDSGYVTTWPGFPPHVVSDSCSCWAAYADSLDESAATVGSGTSSATPFAAGGAARLLLEARTLLGDHRTGIRDGVAAAGDPGAIAAGPLADGVFTLAEWKELVFATASARPAGQYEDGPPCGALDGLVLYGPTPVKWSDVPDGFPEYANIGYGAVDNGSRAVAFEVLRGTIPLPDRSATDEYFAMDAEARQRFYDAYQQVP